MVALAWTDYLSISMTIETSSTAARRTFSFNSIYLWVVEIDRWPQISASTRTETPLWASVVINARLPLSRLIHAGPENGLADVA
jgi:hypothetical protein